MKYLLIIFIFLSSSTFSSPCKKVFSSSVIIDSNGEARQEYTGQESYIKFADVHFKGNMRKAFDTVSFIFSRDNFKKLGWQQFRGSTKEFKELQSNLLDERGELREKYQGQEKGYIKFSDEYYGGDMFKAFQNASSVLSKEMFKKLGWQQFRGSTKEFKELQSKLIDENGELNQEYQGQETGYIKFSDAHYGGDMVKAFKNASSVLSKKMFKKLGWQQFRGSTKEFKELQSKLIDENGELNQEYQGQEAGYIKFSDDHYSGNMVKAFQNASSVLSKEVFKKLGWQRFRGSTKEFKELQSKLLDEDGELKQEYQGQEAGYIKFSDEYYGGNMAEAFQNASSVLSKEVFKKLGWQRFYGSTKEFKELQSKLLDEDGELKQEYQGQEAGYIKFSDAHYGGDMVKAFKNASSVLFKEMFRQLKWKQFQGSTEQFHALISYFRAHSFEDYRGVEGQRKIAELIFENNLQRTYINISSLREYLFINKNVFNDLRESGWSKTLR